MYSSCNFYYDRNLKMSSEAMKAVTNLYLDLRAHDRDCNLPITVRTLEGVARISTAAAKARWETEHVRLVSYSMLVLSVVSCDVCTT